MKSPNSLPQNILGAKRGQKGQTLVEYALIIAIISVTAIAVLINMGTQVTTVYSTTGTQIGIAQVGGAQTKQRAQ